MSQTKKSDLFFYLVTHQFGFEQHEVVLAVPDLPGLSHGDEEAVDELTVLDGLGHVDLGLHLHRQSLS